MAESLQAANEHFCNFESTLCKINTDLHNTRGVRRWFPAFMFTSQVLKPLLVGGILGSAPDNYVPLTCSRT